MREILFRAKRIDNGEWVEGYYFCMTHTDGRHVHHFIIPLGADLSKGTGIEKIQVEIDPETLCRYTGLKDKNGKRIWENDIVSVIFDDEIIYGSIKYGLYNNDFAGEASGSLGFYIDWKEKGNFLRKNIGCWKEELEYAGNIFDDPELLKGE